MALLLLSIVVWVPLVILGISRRGFLILLIWLAIAPIASSVADRRIPVITSGGRAPATYESAARAWSGIHQDVRLDELIREPTRIVLLLFIFTFLLNALLKRRSLLSFDRTEIWMGIFCLILLANIFLQSGRRPYSLRLATDSFILPFAAYYFARRFVTNEHRFAQLTRVLGYVGVYLILIGLIERLTISGLFYRLQGPFRSGTEYYSVLMIMFFAVLVSLVSNWKLPAKRQELTAGVKWFVLCLSPVIVLLTWSRGNWLGFLMAVWVFAFLGFRLISRSQRIGWLGAGMAVFPLALLALSFSVPEEVIEGRVLTTSTLEWRFERWLIALELGLQHPVFGIGFKNLQDVFTNELGAGYGAHNFFLSSFAEIGAVGLLAFLAVMISLSLRGFRLYRKGRSLQERWLGIAIIAVIVGNLMPALFANTIESTNLMLIYEYVFLGAIAGLYPQKKSIPVPARRFERAISDVAHGH
jgi:O-antigen ligase